MPNCQILIYLAISDVADYISLYIGFRRPVGNVSNAGEGGWSVGIFDESNADGIAPVLGDNTITPGAGGLRGAPGTGEAFSGETNF